VRAKKTISGGFSPQHLGLNSADKDKFVEDLKIATYIASLASYIQGINVIEQADRENKWSIDYAAVLQIWRAGCIIQADHLAEMLEPIFAQYQKKDTMNLLFEPVVAKELEEGLPSLRTVVGKAVEGDHIVPALSASLEYIKYQTNTRKYLPFVAGGGV
jgi:6-phosphogluconate dehydrogenase